MRVNWEVQSKNLQEEWFRTKDRKVLDRLFKTVYMYALAIVTRRFFSLLPSRKEEIARDLATEITLSVMKGKGFWALGRFLVKRAKSYAYARKTGPTGRTILESEEAVLDHFSLVRAQHRDRSDDNPESYLRQRLVTDLLESMVDQVEQTIQDRTLTLSPADRELCRIYVLTLLNRWLEGESRLTLINELRGSQLSQREWIKFLTNEVIYRIRGVIKEAMVS